MGKSLCGGKVCYNNGNRRGKFYTGVKLYTDFENRGKLYAGVLFPPWRKFYPGPVFPGGKTMRGENL
jgi:hypothetical protein